MVLKCKNENIVSINEVKEEYLYSDLNLNNILKHIEEVKNFNNSKHSEYFGSYGTQQRGSFRIYRCYENLYISSMLEVKEDCFEKLEICKSPVEAINLYIDFLSKYQFDYIKYKENLNL